MNSAQVITMLEDSRENLWFGTCCQGASRYDGAYFTHFMEREGLPHHTVWSILEDRHGHLWFGTFGGVFRYDGVSFTRYTSERIPQS